MIVENAMAIIRGIFVYIRLNLFSKGSCAGKLLRIGKNCRIRLRKDSCIILGSNVSLGDGVKLSALNGGKIDIGDNVGIGDYNQIVSHKSICIGSDCNIAPFVLFFDHDHEYDPVSGVKRREFRSSEVVIGDNCWIGAATIILRDTHIGNKCLVGAGSVVKGDYPDGTKIIQKRASNIGRV